MERLPNLITGGSFGFGIAAELLFNKFALHVPLYRQQDRFAELCWALGYLRNNWEALRRFLGDGRLPIVEVAPSPSNPESDGESAGE